MEQERLHPEATGELSNLLYDICLAAKIISRQVRRAGLTDILGALGTINVQGELQQKLDVFANETVRNSVQHTGRICIMASEEDEEPVPVPPGKPAGKYVLLYDPLDGSANIDVNVSIGTIFSIHRRVTAKKNGAGTLADCLQRVASRSPPGTSFTDRAPCSCTRPDRACTASRSIRPSASSCSRIRNSHARGGQLLQREREPLEPVDPRRTARRPAHSRTATARDG